MRHRLLIVTFFMPPLPEIRGIQVERLLRHLDHEMLVVCADDPSLRHGNTPSVLPDPSLPMLRVPHDRSPWRRRASNLAARLNLPLLDRSPDRYRDWLRPALDATLERLRTSGFKPTAIVSFAQPWTSHLLGLELKRRLGLPWLAHFSDLWCDGDIPPKDYLTMRNCLRQEARVVAAAQRLVMITEEMQAILMEKYPPAWNDKARILPHYYDPADFGPPEGDPAGRRSIRYMGSLYNTRDPRVLLGPLDLLRRQSPELLEGVCFQFYSDHPRTSQALAPFELAFPGLFEFHPVVPLKQSLALMAGADALLHIDFQYRSGSTMAAKLADYIGAGRPILGITTAEGASGRIITSLGGRVAPLGQDAAIAELFANHLRRPPVPTPWGDPAVRQYHDVRNQARRFGEMLAELPLKGRHQSGAINN